MDIRNYSCVHPFLYMHSHTRQTHRHTHTTTSTVAMIKYVTFFPSLSTAAQGKTIHHNSDDSLIRVQAISWSPMQFISVHMCNPSYCVVKTTVVVESSYSLVKPLCDVGTALSTKATEIRMELIQSEITDAAPV